MPILQYDQRKITHYFEAVKHCTADKNDSHLIRHLTWLTLHTVPCHQIFLQEKHCFAWHASLAVADNVFLFVILEPCLKECGKILSEKAKLRPSFLYSIALFSTQLRNINVFLLHTFESTTILHGSQQAGIGTYMENCWRSTLLSNCHALVHQNTIKWSQI